MTLADSRAAAGVWAAAALLAGCNLCWPQNGVPEVCADDDDATADDDDAANDDDAADDDDTAPDDDDTGPPEPDADGMLPVPAGPFVMGCDSGPDCEDDEGPASTFTLSAFRIDAFETTNAEFAEFLNAHGNDCPPVWCFAELINGDVADVDGTWYARPETASHPIHDVSWYGAEAYCAWRGKRLPTEAEWERAARGTDGDAYPWGNGDPNCGRAIYGPGSPDGCGTGESWPVGSLEDGRSAVGAWDMAGNVWEWTAGWTSDTGYLGWDAVDPTGPSWGTSKAARGGGYSSNGATLAGWNRWSRDPDYGGGTVGMRCAAD
jgi:formylglycine-generating enzyme required for sulfatase activity